MKLENPKVAIIGLGYVGLPLAVEFAKKYFVIGFDINNSRIENLNHGKDDTGEIETTDLNKVLNKENQGEKGLFLTSDISNMSIADIYIVTVPTPIDESKKPDLGPLLKASETIGKVLKNGNLVIY